MVSGKVQGVFFRAKTIQQANFLGVMGWVRNLSDGKVEVVVEGEEEAVNSLVAFCTKGPKGAIVTDAAIRWEIATGEFNNFSIRY